MRNSITDSASRTSQCAYRVHIACERRRPPPERLSDNRHGNLTHLTIETSSKELEANLHRGEVRGGRYDETVD